MRKISAVFGILLCLVMVLSIMPVPARAAQTGEAYNQLPSDMHKQVYHILEEGIASLSPVITFPEDMVIYSYDLNKVARAVCVDHPEYFWFLEAWYYKYETEIAKKRVEYLTPSYFLDGERVSAGSQDLADAMVAFHAKANEIVNGIPINCTSDYDIALYLHDYLIENVTYSLEGNHDSAYSALIHGQAACYGYSKAYQYLLSLAGVRAQTITGDALDPDGTKVGHAWNQVWIDDICYYTDVTWDDWDFTGIHAYFLTSLEIFSKDHIADPMFILPDCSHRINFHEISSGDGVAYLTKQSKPADAAKNFVLSGLKGKKATFTCEIRFQGDFVAWFNKWGADIARNLGASTSSNLEYYYQNDIYYVILTDSNYKLPDEHAQSISLNYSDATLVGNGAQVQLLSEITPAAAGRHSLRYSSSDANVAVVSTSGMVTAVGTGNATITVTSPDGKVSATCTITVLEGKPHNHILRSILESEPNCTQDGSESFYICTTCGKRFVDKDASNEITSVKDYARPATGHQNVKWESDSQAHIKVCSCLERFSDTYGNHIDNDKNGRCDACNHPFRIPVVNSNTHKDKDKPNYIFPILIGIAVIIAVPVIIIVKRRL